MNKTYNNIRNKYNKLIKNLILLTVILPVVTFTSGCENDQLHVTNIGILLFGDSRQPQVDGFIDEMKRAGFDDKTTNYVVLNAKNKRKALPDLVRQLVGQKPDLLVAAGGLEADMMKKSADQHNIPVVVLYVNAIIERGLVKSRSNTGWNATGVDNLNAELSGKRVELIKELLPSTKRILILYYERIAPSRIGVLEATTVADKIGIIVDSRAVKSRDEIKTIMASLKPGEVDVMLTVPTAPIDNALKDIILPDIERLEIPLFTHSRPLAELGAFASYGSDFYELGQQAARLAEKILNGVAAANIPFEIPRSFKYTINKDVQSRLSIQIKDSSELLVNDFVKTR